MKKRMKKNGFAMVEVLIAAVSVISIFALLYNTTYPIIGSYNTIEKYDDLDSKYVAFYIKEMLETDSNFSVGSISFNNPDCANTCSIYKTYAYKVDSAGIDIKINDVDTINDHYLYKNELCNQLTESNNTKNNQYFCNKYITGAEVTNIYVTKYDVSEFKGAVKNSSRFSRGFKNYVSYMPSHTAASSTKKNNYYRIIVEIEHDSYNTADDIYYTYSSIEVKK